MLVEAKLNLTRFSVVLQLELREMWLGEFFRGSPKSDTALKQRNRLHTGAAEKQHPRVWNPSVKLYNCCTSPLMNLDDVMPALVRGSYGDLTPGTLALLQEWGTMRIQWPGSCTTDSDHRGRLTKKVWRTTESVNSEGTLLNLTLLT